MLKLPEQWTLSEVLELLQDDEILSTQRSWAWERLYSLTRPHVFAACYRITKGDINLIADICQDVYAELLQKRTQLKSIDGPKHLLAYLKVMACHTAIDHLRARNRHSPPPPPGGENMVLDFRSEGVEEVAIRNEFCQILLEQLSDSDRELFLLNLEGFSVSQISEHLHISRNSAAVRVHRLRERLKRLLVDLHIPGDGL